MTKQLAADMLTHLVIPTATRINKSTVKKSLGITLKIRINTTFFQFPNFQMLSPFPFRAAF